MIAATITTATAITVAVVIMIGTMTVTTAIGITMREIVEDAIAIGGFAATGSRLAPIPGAQCAEDHDGSDDNDEGDDD
jgi:hypothetical protein